MDRFRNKTDQTFFIENVARNGLKSHFLGPKSAPFCCKNANLPSRTCFTRIPPPPPEKVSIWGFSADLYSFSSFGGGEPNFADKNFLDFWQRVGDWCFTTTGADAPGRSTGKNQYW